MSDQTPRRWLVPIWLREKRHAIVLATSRREALEHALAGRWEEVYDPVQFTVKRAPGKIEEEA